MPTPHTPSIRLHALIPLIVLAIPLLQGQGRR
jgi:hypothetical protein